MMLLLLNANKIQLSAHLTSWPIMVIDSFPKLIHANPSMLTCNSILTPSTLKLNSHLGVQI